MDRKSIVVRTRDFYIGFRKTDYRYNHFDSCFLPRLMDRVYSSRGEAYKAIDKFIDDFNEEKYFEGIKGILKPYMFKIVDAPKYRIEGFDSNDDYLAL